MGREFQQDPLFNLPDDQTGRVKVNEEKSSTKPKVSTHSSVGNTFSGVINGAMDDAEEKREEMSRIALGLDKPHGI